MIKHVVMFSSGAGSAWLAKNVADKYGKENTILLFTDTKWEDEDNYRFANECSEYVGVPITYQNDGRTPEDVFKEENFFGNFGMAPCSKKLKMMQTFEFIQNMFMNGDKPILYFGIGYEEARRAPRIAYNYKHNIDVFEDGLEVRFPLIGEIEEELSLMTIGEPERKGVTGEQLVFGTDYLEEGNMPKITNKIVYECLSKQNFVQCTANPKKEIAEEWGIELPRMYKLGFSHANCAGRCVKAGKGHFANLYKVWPHQYADIERIEKEINEKQIAKSGKRYTILSKTIELNELDENGKPKKQKIPYSLQEYREQELETDADLTTLDLFNIDDAPCECVF